MKVVAAILVCFVVEAVFAGSKPTKEFICPGTPHERDVEYFGKNCDVVAYNDYILDASTGSFTQLTRYGQIKLMMKEAFDKDCHFPLNNEENHKTENKVVEEMRKLNADIKKFAELYLINTADSKEKLNPKVLGTFLSVLEKNKIKGVIITPYLEVSVADTVKLLPELTKALMDKNMQVYFAAPAVKEADLTDDVVQKMKSCDKVIMKTSELAERNFNHFDAPLSGNYNYTIEKTLEAYLTKGFSGDKLVGALSMDGARYVKETNDIQFASFMADCDDFNDTDYKWSLDKEAMCFVGETEYDWIEIETPETMDVKSKALLSKTTGGIIVYELSLDNDGWEERCKVDRYALLNPIMKNLGKVQQP